jgi:hypothetical protein
MSNILNLKTSNIKGFRSSLLRASKLRYVSQLGGDIICQQGTHAKQDGHDWWHTMTEKVSYLVYADDVLVVINDFWELPKVLEIYDEYAAGSNTRLNVSKTEGITMYGSSDLWRERFPTIKWFDEMSDFCPMYLGYPLTTSKTHMKQALTNVVDSMRGHLQWLSSQRLSLGGKRLHISFLVLL